MNISEENHKEQFEKSIKAQPKEKKQTKTVLIAEDEIYNFNLIEELLSELKLEILHAPNGQIAVEMSKTKPDIALILMDIKMPLMNGYQAATIIKKDRPYLPIIAQSAFALEDEIDRYADIFDDYITKPIDEDILIEKVKKALYAN